MPSSGCKKCADRKSTRLNSSHTIISYAVFCLKKKNLRRVVMPSCATPAHGRLARGTHALPNPTHDARAAGRSARGLRATWLRFFFFFNDTATTEIYTLSLHDSLPI